MDEVADLTFVSATPLEEPEAVFIDKKCWTDKPFFLPDKERV